MESYQHEFWPLIVSPSNNIALIWPVNQYQGDIIDSFYPKIPMAHHCGFGQSLSYLFRTITPSPNQLLFITMSMFFSIL